MEIGLARLLRVYFLTRALCIFLESAFLECTCGNKNHIFAANVRVLSHFLRTMATVGHLKRICKDAFSVARSTKDMLMRDVRRSGR